MQSDVDDMLILCEIEKCTCTAEVKERRSENDLGRSQSTLFFTLKPSICTVVVVLFDSTAKFGVISDGFRQISVFLKRRTDRSY